MNTQFVWSLFSPVVSQNAHFNDPLSTIIFFSFSIKNVIYLINCNQLVM